MFTILDDLKDDSIEFINNNSLGLTRDINVAINKIASHILLIDESNYNFRSNIENWTTYVKNGIERINRYIPNLSRIARSSVLNKKDDGLKDFFLNKRSNSKNTQAFEEYLEMHADLSLENRRNLNLSLIHILMYMTNFSIIIPSLFKYIEKLTNNEKYGVLCGCILSICIVSSFLNQTYFFKMTKRYKALLLVSIFLVIIGNLFYVFAGYFESIYLIIFSQIFIGFGNFRIMNRTYLIQYSPKHLHNNYSYYYLICNALGLVLGKLSILIIINKHSQSSPSLKFITYF